MHAAARPILHVKFDLWTSNVPHDKYVGIRIFWMTSAFVRRTTMLAVEQFGAAPLLTDSNQLPDVLHVWGTEVLEEGLVEEDVCLSVTHGGSGVTRHFLKPAQSKWKYTAHPKKSCSSRCIAVPSAS